MATVKQIAGTLTSLTVTGLSTLASATYVASAVKDNTANQPVDVVVEIAVASTNTVAGNKQIVVFCIASFDNTNFSSGPTSGTTTTDEANLVLLGVVPLPTASQTERRQFSVAAAFGGVLPPYFKVVVKNDIGVALTTGSVSTAEISVTVA